MLFRLNLLLGGLFFLWQRSLAVYSADDLAVTRWAWQADHFLGNLFGVKTN
jgi:hypothetical protein